MNDLQGFWEWMESNDYNVFCFETCMECGGYIDLRIDNAPNQMLIGYMLEYIDYLIKDSILSINQKIAFGTYFQVSSSRFDACIEIIKELENGND